MWVFAIFVSHHCFAVELWKLSSCLSSLCLFCNTHTLYRDTHFPALTVHSCSHIPLQFLLYFSAPKIRSDVSDSERAADLSCMTNNRLRGARHILTWNKCCCLRTSVRVVTHPRASSEMSACASPLCSILLRILVRRLELSFWLTLQTDILKSLLVINTLYSSRNVALDWRSVYQYWTLTSRHNFRQIPLSTPSCLLVAFINNYDAVKQPHLKWVII